MYTISRRLRRLEALHGAAEALRENRVPHHPEMRVITSVVGGGLPDLANSKCKRYVVNGKLMEVVRIEGEPASLSPGELESFIGSFPITFA